MICMNDNGARCREGIFLTRGANCMSQFLVRFPFILVVAILLFVGCSQQNSAVQSTTILPEMAPPLSPITSPLAPVSPVSVPAHGRPVPLPANLISQLPEYTINNNIRADFIPLPFYDLLTWTGITWDGGDYIWIINNQMKAIAGFNIEKGINDRLVSFPFDLKESPTITGLTWDGKYFWLADVANTMIHQIDPITGNRLQGFVYDGTPNGLAWVGDDLWVVSKDRLAIEKVQLPGTRQFSLALQGTWPTGLAWDGRYFWYSDAHEGAIYILNPSNSKSKKVDAIKFMTNPGTFNGLAWMSGYLWIVTEGDQRLHRFDVSQLDWKALDVALQ
jgi:hypothetical protein